jgi:nitrite reductase/ring-hydroxylating ferredoxin subunit
MSDFPIKVTDVTQGSFPDMWLGQAQLPRKSEASKVLIFLRDGNYVLTPALCPHLAFDMSEANLNEIGELICPLHGFVVNLFVAGGVGEIRERGSKANKSGYFVTRKEDEFEITGFNQ